ncbi:ACT domain-containing protein [Nocardiopsis flavescens]|uniref:ACT domain-containing protein n=1 Tax=Nocardiopsis flavescens TaxID=758803 RepID=A0A1M6QD67_9ACTN|nr:ACT domain-containing protein [Nocardiopsis flavescens]SHK18126.1 ACT domain-containing protein [Nocardiopsis flavescens]
MDSCEAHRGNDDRSTGFLGREALDFGVLLLAAGAAHLVVLSLGHSDGGVRVLLAVGALLVVASGLHRWRRHRRAPLPGAAAVHRPHRAGAPYDPPGDRLWSVRVTVADVPGGLAALTAGFAALGIDIRLMHVHPAGTEAVDEFFVSAPAHVGAHALHAAVREAGGRDAIVRTADPHELSDTTSRTLALVGALAAGNATLEHSLLSLAAAQRVDTADAPPAGLGREDLSGTVMTLPAPDGRVLVVRRSGAPFTSVEFARCRALAQVAATLRSPAAGS